MIGMPEPVKWKREPHTEAKHRVLRAYIDAWIPVMAHQALKVRSYQPGTPRLLLVDGFSGPGRYAEGEPGSPLIMLEALLSHAAFGALGDVKFIFLFIEYDRRRFDALGEEIAQLGELPPNVEILRRHGAFEDVFSEVVGSVEQPGLRLVPTFAFIDPFGYAHASMSLAGRLLNFPRCEALYFLPLSYVHRFVGREGQEVALSSLFGTDEWRNAIPLKGDERKQFLLDLFERQLMANSSVDIVRSFQLRTQEGMDYRLVFALGNRKGLELAKDAMWKVDPVQGTSYSATTAAGQEVMFGGSTVDTGPLLQQLRATYGEDWFTPRQAEDTTLFDTPFRIGHLRQKTLKPAIRDGTLECRPSNAKALQDNVKLRFTTLTS
jgi:three-Cys-motif partner protein